MAFLRHFFGNFWESVERFWRKSAFNLNEMTLGTPSTVLSASARELAVAAACRSTSSFVDRVVRELWSWFPRVSEKLKQQLQGGDKDSSETQVAQKQRQRGYMLPMKYIPHKITL